MTGAMYEMFIVYYIISANVYMLKYSFKLVDICVDVDDGVISEKKI